MWVMKHGYESIAESREKQQGISECLESGHSAVETSVDRKNCSCIAVVRPVDISFRQNADIVL